MVMDDYQDEREKPILPEDAAILRLSRVVDVSNLNPRPHSKTDAAKKSRKPALKNKNASAKSSHISPQQRHVAPQTTPTTDDIKRPKRAVSQQKISQPPTTTNKPQLNTTTNKTSSIRLSGKHPRVVRDRLSHYHARSVAKSLNNAASERKNDAHHTETIETALLLQSWHAKKWAQCIVNLSPTIASQVDTAMPLVQAGLVNNICIAPERLEATIFDQVVSITLRTFTPGQWRVVIDMLSDRAIFATSLLNAELPEGILDIFKQASLSLYPTKISEFSFTCDCEPEIAPCKHACALLIAFAQMLEEDPFLILTLRGMTRDALLSQLRDARSDQVVSEKTRHRINYELPAQNVDFDTFFSAKGDFSTLNFHISYNPSTLLKRLGQPQPWDADIPLFDILHPVMDAASREAESLGQCEHYEIASNEKSEPPAQENSRPPLRTNPKKAFISTKTRPAKRIQPFNLANFPDIKSIVTRLPQDILDILPQSPLSIAEDILKWLYTRGSSDIRTLARRTRLHKETIEAFLKIFCDCGITKPEIEGEKIRYAILNRV